MTVQLEAALALARAGVPVFPCRRDNKTPLAEHGFKDASADPELVRRCWSRFPDALVGVPTGEPSGLWVLDLDVDRETGEHLGAASIAGLGIAPPPWVVRTSSGGEHWLYRHRDGLLGNTAGRLRGVDTRGDGGYAIAWNPDVILRALRDPALPEPPEELIQALVKPKPVNGTPYAFRLGDAEVWAETALDAEATAVAHAAEGSRNHTLNTAAFNLGQIVGGGHLERGRVVAELAAAAAACGLGPRETEGTIQSGLGAGMASPRGPRGGRAKADGPKPRGNGPRPAEPKPEPERDEWGRRIWPDEPSGQDGLQSDDEVEPVDLWALFPPPSLPRGVLPPAIEDFAFAKGGIMGVDPGGLAIAALAVCAGALTDAIKLQVKRHDLTWLESARLWVALIGEPSTKKSPALDAAIHPLATINAGLRREYDAAKAKWDKLPKEQKEQTDEPILRKTILGDATIEAAQVALRDNPQGLLCHQDELAGWFGAMDKYAGPRGAAKDRGFWLTSFNGGPYSVERVGRGASLIENLSVCVLGGIQPGPVRALAANGHDDGLFARLCPVIVGPAEVGRDELMSDAEKIYGGLVEALHRRQPEAASRFNGYKPPVLRFDDGAQTIRQNLEAKHLDLQKSFEAINRKLAAHIGKYDGLFARLCVLWHAVETIGWEVLPATIPADVAARVERFLHGFLLPHAIAFYAGMLGLSDDHDSLAAVAGYILARRLEVVTNRDVQRGNRTMRGLKRHEVQRIFEQLEALGWLHEVPPRRVTGASHWAVNPKCHQHFRDRGQYEADTRDKARAQIAESLRDARNG